MIIFSLFEAQVQVLWKPQSCIKLLLDFKYKDSQNNLFETRRFRIPFLLLNKNLMIDLKIIQI
jgi:hypothetical protein